MEVGTVQSYERGLRCNECRFSNHAMGDKTGMIIHTRRTKHTIPADEHNCWGGPATWETWEAFDSRSQFMSVEGHKTQKDAIAAFVLQNLESLGLEISIAADLERTE